MKKILSMALVLVLCAGIISGCRLWVTPVYYENAELYSAGGADISQPVERVEIQWLSGKVTLSACKEKTVRFSEQANRTLTNENTLHYRLDGTTLLLQFCASGCMDFNNLEKELTVQLPEKLALKELTINGTSADLEVGSINAEELNINTVSGPLEVTDCTVTEKADIETVSGSVTARLLGEIKELCVNTVSGNISVAAHRIDTVDMDSTSGELLLSAEETSGKIDADTVSGEVTLILPENAGMTLRYDTVSGDFSSELPGKTEGGLFVSGDGSCECKVNTTSGDLKLQLKR